MTGSYRGGLYHYIPVLRACVKLAPPPPHRALFCTSPWCNIISDSIEGLAPRQHLLYLEAPV